MALVFLSYRSYDAGDTAAHLRLRLAECFGADQVFLDHQDLRVGRHYPDGLREQLERADVLVALIGPRWLERDPDSPDPAEPPGTWVRYELTRAVERGIPIVPLLLDREPPAWPAGTTGPLVTATRPQAARLRRRDLAADLATLTAVLAREAPALLVDRLREPALPPAPAALPSALLRPERGVVPFDGRDAELAELTAWATGGERLRLLTGPAGQGKSRLAAELCERLEEAGTVAVAARGTLTGAELAAVGTLGRPVLLVVDRAEQRVPQLADLLGAMAAAPAVRMLLVARTGADWTDPLAESPDDAVADLVAGMRTRPLGPLVPDPSGREAEYARAAARFAAELGRPGPPPAPPADLERAAYGRALDLHGAALAAVLGAAGDDDPLLRVLHQEKRYWADTAPAGSTPDQRLRAVAAATVFGAADDRSAAALLAAALPAADPDPYARWLRRLYPAAAGLDGLRPDRLGEDVAAEAHRRSPRLLVGCAAVADTGQLSRALEVLGRAAGRHPELRPAVEELLRLDPRRMLPLALTAALALARPDVLTAEVAAVLDATRSDPELPLVVADALPDRAIGLARFSVATLRGALERSTDPARSAYLLANLAARLADLGAHREAADAAQEAVAAYRGLAPRQDVTARLAGALTNLAVALIGLGRPDAALAAAEEALSLMDTGPAGVRPTAAAKARLVLASLSTGPRRVAVLRDAVLQARVAGDGPEETAVLAAAVQNLGLALPAADDAAPAAVQEAVTRLRALADDVPDPYARDLVRALTNLAGVRLRRSEPAAAEAAGREAVDRARALVRRHGDGGHRLLATALVNHSLATADRALACREAEEAVALCPDPGDPLHAQAAANRDRICATGSHPLDITAGVQVSGQESPVRVGEGERPDRAPESL